MLKIYRASANNGEIKLDDYISFRSSGINNEFNTGANGFGIVNSANPRVTRANYELQALKSFREYIQSVKTTDGFVDDFMLWNPMTYAMLEEKYKDIPKNDEAYEKYGLNEEGILLFTHYINLLNTNDDNLVQRVFGRYEDNGMYLIMPNASFELKRGSFGVDISRRYEVFQSQNLGKKLVLSEIKRKI